MTFGRYWPELLWTWPWLKQDCSNMLLKSWKLIWVTSQQKQKTRVNEPWGKNKLLETHTCWSLFMDIHDRSSHFDWWRTRVCFSAHPGMKIRIADCTQEVIPTNRIQCCGRTFAIPHTGWNGPCVAPSSRVSADGAVGGGVLLVHMLVGDYRGDYIAGHLTSGFYHHHHPWIGIILYKQGQLSWVKQLHLHCWFDGNYWLMGFWNQLRTGGPGTSITSGIFRFLTLLNGEWWTDQRC